MSYDKSHIPTIADDVVNGRIDESTALSLFPEDLQRILKVEIGKRIRNRGYNRDKIGDTTDRGIPYLADDIVLGFVNEEVAFKNLFKDYHKQLTNEITRRREDEVLWNQALASRTIEMFEKYLDIYNNPDSTYAGRYVSRAEEFIRLIVSDDKEWTEAKRLDTEDAYLHYLEVYDKPEPSYRGKHVKEVKEAIVRLKDNKNWDIACELNTLQSYSDYLSLYDRVAPDYIGLHVKEAHLALFRIADDSDWSHVTNLNTIESYESYINKYDVASSAYRGKYIEEAKEAVKSLTPPPAPDPRIKDDDAWVKATKINTKDSYQEYLTEYGHTSADGYLGSHIQEAECAIRHIIDEEAWAKAKLSNTSESYQEYLNTCKANDYPGYIWKHYNAASTNIVNLKKSAEIRAQKEQDDADWNEAVRQNTVEAYKRYLSIHNSGIHNNEALDAIADLEKQAFVSQENMDWQSACKSNTLSAYKSFVSKYSAPSLKFKSIHLDAVKQKIAELTPPAPVPSPIKWWKWMMVAIVVLGLGWLTYVQWHDNAWPFSLKSDEVEEPVIIVEEVDSLQWAIDNHDIPLLTRYAEQDSVRAYFPLASELYARGDDYDIFGKWVVKTFNSPDSIPGRKLWDRYSRTIVDGLTDSVKDAFEKIDWSNSNFAEKRCQDIYSVYINNIDTSIIMLQSPQRITSLEMKVNDYISSWEKVISSSKNISSEGEKRYREWCMLKNKFDSVVNYAEDRIMSNYYKMKYNEY